MKMKHSPFFNFSKVLLFLFLCTVSFSALAQNITVKGIVTDTRNESVIGAAVMVQGNLALMLMALMY